jgi:biotin carboxyl carrier protein
VPEPTSRASRPDREPGERAADHAAIDRLAGELLPALIAKLGATGLGELEVHEGAWRVRLRRPGGPAARERRAADRALDRAADRAADRAHPAPSRPHHPAPYPAIRSDSRSIATSPAVGIFQPRKDLAIGARVRAGDRLGAVDMLGVAQEVVAPIDGVVGTSLVEAGEAVEYGQDLVTIEFSVPVSTNGTGPG